MTSSFLFAGIQIICGISAAILIFIGISRPIKQLNGDNRSQEISKDTIFNSTILIIIGLLLFSITKGITNYMATNKATDVFLTCYTAALISVIKNIGFIALVPFILDYIRATNNKHKQAEK